jgi:hypothetical protein
LFEAVFNVLSWLRLKKKLRIEILGSLAMTDLYTWNCSLWVTRWDQGNGFVWGSFLRDILTEAEEKFAYRDYRITRHDWFYIWNCSLWVTRWGQRNGCFIWGSFLRDILTEAEEKVAYRDLLIIKVHVRDTDCQSLCLRFLPGLFYTCYKVWVILWCVLR